MPGHAQMTVDLLADEAREIAKLGIPAVILFGIPARRTQLAARPGTIRGVVQQAIRAIKDAAPDLLVITDVCFCEFTDHGHCGVLIETTVTPMSGTMPRWRISSSKLSATRRPGPIWWPPAG